MPDKKTLPKVKQDPKIKPKVKPKPKPEPKPKPKLKPKPKPKPSSPKQESPKQQQQKVIIEVEKREPETDEAIYNFKLKHLINKMKNQNTYTDPGILRFAWRN